MFRIIVPLYNATLWLPRCLASIKRQKFTEWTCHLADDCSDDRSSELVRELIGSDPRFVLSHNPERLYQCGTYLRLLSDPDLDDHDVCVTVDADGNLPDESVFDRVIEAYSDPSVWLTWGTYSRTDGGPGITGPLEDSAQIRNVSWRTSHLRTSHLRTWRLFLWRSIDPRDFLGPTGEPLRVAGDLAFMFPMLEMAGNHIKYSQPRAGLSELPSSPHP